MQTNLLKRNHPNMKRMIVARGGKRGKTSGRGGKGQSARAGNKRRPEWRDIIKKLPKLRGRGVNQNKPIALKPVGVNLSLIEGTFSAGDAITPKILIDKGIISTWSGKIPAVKILGDGDVTKALKISGCTISESAKAKIEKAGGSVTPMSSRVIEKVTAPKTEKAPSTEKSVASQKEVVKKEVKKEVKKTTKLKTEKKSDK